MLRLIYLNSLSEYQYFDSESKDKIENIEVRLENQGADIVCLVDYSRQFIYKKSKDYVTHRDYIDDLIFDPQYVTNF
jgi:hypothetical protein